MRIFSIILISLFFHNLNAQKKIFTGPAKDNISEIISVVNKENGEVALLNFHTNGIIVDLFNSKFEIIKTIISEGLPSKFESLIGYQFKDDKLSILMNTSNNRSYAFALFDFKNGVASTQELEFKLKKEFYLASFSRDNLIFMITASKKDSQMNIYKFDGYKNDPSKSELIIPENTFIDRFDRSIDFYDALYGGKREHLEAPVIINRDLPTTIEETKSPLKLYSTKDGFKLSIDSGIECTYVIDGSLKDGRLSVKRFDYDKPEKKFAYRMKTNSFIFDDKLFQFSLNSNTATLKIIDLISGEVKKELLINREDDLAIANTPIIQLGGEFKNYRELETTNQFFRKSLQGAHLGLSVIKRNGNFEITFGNVLEIENGSYYIPYSGRGALGGMFAGGLFTLTSELIDYRKTKSVYFTGLFTSEFEHIKGEVTKNTLDEVSEFSDDLNIGAETLFQLEDNYYYGYLDKSSDSFFIYEF